MGRGTIIIKFNVVGEHCHEGWNRGVIEAIGKVLLALSDIFLDLKV